MVLITEWGLGLVFTVVVDVNATARVVTVVVTQAVSDVKRRVNRFGTDRGLAMYRRERKCHVVIAETNHGVDSSTACGKSNRASMRALYVTSVHAVL